MSFVAAQGLSPHFRIASVGRVSPGCKHAASCLQSISFHSSLSRFVDSLWLLSVVFFSSLNHSRFVEVSRQFAVLSPELL